MAVKGVFTSDAGIVGDRKGDFAGALLNVVPTGSAQLLALSAGMKSVDAQDTVITWFEENHISGRISVTNNAASGTTFTVDDATIAIAGDIYMVESTGEYVLATSISGSDLTVTRGFAGTSVSALDGSSTPEPIQRVGTAFEEGSAKPNSYANLGYPRFNYMQIFRNAWDVTRTARRIAFHTTNDIVAKNRADGGNMHAEDIERALWFGKKSLGTQNGNPFRTFDGLDAQITTNVSTQSTDVQYTDLRDFLQGVFERNIKGQPNERLAFCGNTILGVLDTLATNWGTMNLQPGQTEFGMKITKWMTPFGDISLVTHPLFNESPLWTKDLRVIHPAAVRMRYLDRTFEDSYDKNGTRAGADADYGVWTTELSVEYMAERTGGRYTGIDTADTTNL